MQGSHSNQPGHVASSIQNVSVFENRIQSLRVRLLPRSGFALALLANLIWGTSFVASKVTLTVWGPFTASALRFAIALAGMVLVFFSFGYSIQIPRGRKAWLRIFFVSVSGFGILYPLQLFGMMAIPSSLSASIMLSSPLFVLIFATGFLGETLSVQKIIAISVGMVGGVILVSPANLSNSAWSLTALPQLITGFAFTIGASLSLALSVIATRSASKDLDSRSLTFWSMCFGELLLIPFALHESQPTVATGDRGYAILALVFLALVCSVFAFLIWNRALALTSPQEIASTMHIKTPVAVILGVFIAGEPLTASIIAGTALISFAVWLSQWRPVAKPLPMQKSGGF